MKRKLLIVLLLTWITAPGIAQQKSWTGYIAGSEWPDASIIRTWNDSLVVAKYSYGGKRYLSLCTIYNFMGTSANDSVAFPSAYTIPIPDSLDILDFRIIHDSLVFCGIYAGTEAAYGVVSPALYNYVYPPSANDVFRIFHTSMVSRLTRLTVSQGKMFAVGEYQNTAACVIEVEDILGVASVMRYSYVGAGTEAMHEILDDVVAVDNRIVFLGRDARQTGYNQLTLRSGNTSLGLLDPELGNDYHWMAPEQNILANVRGAATEDDMMAVAFAQTNLQTGVHSLQVHHVTPCPGVPTTQSAQGHLTNVVCSVSEAVYIQPLHWLTVLSQLNGFASSLASFSVPGAGATPMSYSPNDRYNSIDLLGTTAIVGWGARKLTLQKAQYPTISCLPLNIPGINPYPVSGWQCTTETISTHLVPLIPATEKRKPITENLYRQCAAE